MLKRLQMGLRTFMLIASKVWSCFCYMFKKQYRALAQYQSVKYEMYPLSPVSRHRLSEQHCTAEHGSYTKNLSSICDDLNRVFILDNSPGAYRDFPDNAIPIKSWFSDPLDVSLLNLLPVLDALRFTHDVRSVLSRNLHLHRLW
ncbi:Dullard [Operophtera brumata]|uniref:Mitochondrial import inner membrane translocase subunit TIM50 n=1 Tax=Operophtera brumata TaxID=104452 RepID=A0A0L7LDU6_OPEBR|nr:Dullard [Operophtera brumata]